MPAAFAHLSAKLGKGEPSDVQVDHLHAIHDLFCHHCITADSSSPKDQGLFLLVSQHEKIQEDGWKHSPSGRARTSKSAESRTVEQEAQVSKVDHLG